MNQLGVALSAESQRTSNKARGCIGVVGAARIIDLDLIEQLSFPDKTIATLIPVDSFESFFSKKTESFNNNFASSGDSPDLLTDLLLVRFILPANEQDCLKISAVGIEAKYVSSKRSEQFKSNALEQALTSYKNLKHLVENSKYSSALPFRAALIKLCEFALRLRFKVGDENFINSESIILKALVNGNIAWQEDRVRGVVVINGAYEGCTNTYR